MPDTDPQAPSPPRARVMIDDHGVALRVLHTSDGCLYLSAAADEQEGAWVEITPQRRDEAHGVIFARTDPAPQSQPDAGPLDLEEIRTRADAATRRPWTYDDDGGGVIVRDFVGLEPVAHVGGAGRQVHADALFISAARDDVPALLAEVERLTRERGERLTLEESSRLARQVDEARDLALRYRAAWHSARRRAQQRRAVLDATCRDRDQLGIALGQTRGELARTVLAHSGSSARVICGWAEWTGVADMPCMLAPGHTGPHCIVDRAVYVHEDREDEPHEDPGLPTGTPSGLEESGDISSETGSGLRCGRDPQCSGCQSCWEEAMAAAPGGDQGFSATTEDLPPEVHTLLLRQEQMLAGWAESAPEGQRASPRQQELWRALHEAADAVRELTPSRAEKPDNISSETPADLRPAQTITVPVEMQVRILDRLDRLEGEAAHSDRRLRTATSSEEAAPQPDGALDLEAIRERVRIVAEHGSPSVEDQVLRTDVPALVAGIDRMRAMVRDVIAALGLDRDDPVDPVVVAETVRRERDEAHRQAAIRRQAADERVLHIQQAQRERNEAIATRDRLLDENVHAYSQGVEDMRDAAARAAREAGGPRVGIRIERYVRDCEIGDRYDGDDDQARTDPAATRADDAGRAIEEVAGELAQARRERDQARSEAEQLRTALAAAGNADHTQAPTQGELAERVDDLEEWRIDWDYGPTHRHHPADSSQTYCGLPVWGTRATDSPSAVECEACRMAPRIAAVERATDEQSRYEGTLADRIAETEHALKAAVDAMTGLHRRIAALEQRDEPSPHQITVELSGADDKDVERLLRKWARTQGGHRLQGLGADRRSTPDGEDTAAAEEATGE